MYKQSQKCFLTMDNIFVSNWAKTKKFRFTECSLCCSCHKLYQGCYTKVVIQIPTRPMRHWLIIARFNYKVFQEQQRQPKWRNAHQCGYRLHLMKSVADTYPSVLIIIKLIVSQYHKYDISICADYNQTDMTQYHKYDMMQYHNIS